MTNFKVAICSKSRTEECSREAAYRSAEVALDEPSARLALALFDASMSQWRISMGGAVGLDYQAVFQVAAVLRIDVDEDVFSYLRVLEADQLEAMQQSAEARKKA
jgi:hypothetical protein